MLVPIEKIKVKKRVRKDLGNLSDLKDSLRTYGLLNPIIMFPPPFLGKIITILYSF